MAIKINWRNILKAKSKRQQDLSTWTDEDWGSAEQHRAKAKGKKPKGSARRLYTDENPKDTVPVKFKTAKDVRETFSSSAFKNKPHKRQSQIINLVEQRLRAAVRNAKDPKVKKRLKAAHTYAKQRKEASKQKTKSRSRGAFTR